MKKRRSIPYLQLLNLILLIGVLYALTSLREEMHLLEGSMARVVESSDDLTETYALKFDIAIQNILNLFKGNGS